MASKIITILDLCIGAWVAICGAVSFIWNFFHFQIGGLFGSLFVICFGVLIVLYNLMRPGFIVQFFGFFEKWLCCGFCVWGGGHIVTFVFGIIIIIVGIVYIVFNFIGVERPDALLGGGSSASSGAPASQPASQPAGASA